MLINRIRRIADEFGLRYGYYAASRPSGLTARLQCAGFIAGLTRFYGNSELASWYHRLAVGLTRLAACSMGSNKKGGDSQFVILFL